MKKFNCKIEEIISGSYCNEYNKPENWEKY